MDVFIRHANNLDALTIARLHAASWKASYHGILASEYLAKDVDRERQNYWQGAVANEDYSLILIAEVGQVSVGFIAAKETVEDGYGTIIEHLHVSENLKGKGLGRKLMAETTKELIARDETSVCLWVFEDNMDAIRFYEKLGGVTDAFGVDKFADSNAKDRRIGWHDLPALLAKCEDTS